MLLTFFYNLFQEPAFPQKSIKNIKIFIFKDIKKHWFPSA